MKDWLITRAVVPFVLTFCLLMGGSIIWDSIKDAKANPALHRQDVKVECLAP
jgi:hypothetical protein